MSKMIVTLLLVALAVAPSLAQEKATKVAGDVTFECKVEGSDKDGFNFSAKNRGGNVSCETICTLTLTKKDGSTSTKKSEYNGSVTGGDILKRTLEASPA
jgi:hypothetical protein